MSLKREELADPGSCLNKAGEDERIFVLRAKDAAAPAAIRAWCTARVAAGLNKPGDEKIRSALDCADRMDQERPALLAAAEHGKATPTADPPKPATVNEARAVVRAGYGAWGNCHEAAKVAQQLVCGDYGETKACAGEADAFLVNYFKAADALIEGKRPAGKGGAA